MGMTNTDKNFPATSIDTNGEQTDFVGVTNSRRRSSPREFAAPTKEAHNGYNKHGRPVLNAEGRAAAKAIDLTYLFDAEFEPLGDGAHICGRPNGPLKAACRACVLDGLQRVTKHAQNLEPSALA